MVTRIPSTDLLFIVTSPDPKRADRLFQGLRIISMAHGCAVQDSGMRQPMLDNPEGSVRGGSACAYQGGWLVGSAWLDATQAAQVADLMGAPVGSEAACPSPSGVSTVEYWLVRLRYPNTEQATYVPFDACNATPLTERLWELAKPPVVSLRS
jgi:hypothetical protein